MPSYPQLTLRDLHGFVGPKPQERAKKSRVIKIRTRKNLRRFSFIVVSSETYSNPKGHLVSFTYPTLKIPLKDLRNHPEITPMNQRVKIRCTCQAWRYWGSAFLSTLHGYFLDDKETRPALIRDPGEKNYICKHAVRAILFTRMLTFPGLLHTFSVPTNERKSAYVPHLKPIVAGYLHDEGYSAEDIDDVLFSLTEDNFEDKLIEHGVMIPEEDQE